MALITLAEYKAMIGIGVTDTRNDTQISALLEAASLAVIGYTNRNFTVQSGSATSRTYNYDGCGILDIDDCIAVTGVQYNIPNASPYILAPEEWTPMPGDGGLVYYYLLLYTTGYFSASPEMGFARNLDTYPGGYYKEPPTISVTATWGWPAIPEDVKWATALTIQGFVAPGSQSTEGLTAEAIEGWSRSWGSRTGGLPALAVPNRARDLLVNYQRINV